MAGRGWIAGLRLPIAGAAAAMALWAAPAEAGTIAVTTTADGPGGCSLREAVRSANEDADIGGCHDTGAPKRVALGAGTYHLTKQGAGENAAHTGDVDITSSMRIVGAGTGQTTVTGAGLDDRIFDVLNAATDAQIAQLTVTHAHVEGNTGGGVHNVQADLVLNRVAVQDNKATGGSGGVNTTGGSLVLKRASVEGNRSGPSTASGGVGAVGLGTELTIVDSKITNNRTGAFGGGIYGNSSIVIVKNSVISGNKAGTYAGGIYALGGTFDLIGSRVTGNRARDEGGGTYVQVSDLTLLRSTVAGNRSKEASGGGVYLTGSSSSMTARQSTISGNEAADDGGGLRIVNGTADLINSTISGNRAADNGGGFYSGTSTGSTPAVTARNATVARNVADSDEAVGGAGGGFLQLNGSISLIDSLIGQNSDLGTLTAPDCGGTISASFTLFGNLTGCSIAGGGDNNQAPPLLKPLDANGGPTKTHALKSASPAIEAGDPATPGAGGTTCETIDQRGVARPQGDICDAGAFERK